MDNTYHRGFIWATRPARTAYEDACHWARLYADGYWRVTRDTYDRGVTVIVSGEPTVTMLEAAHDAH